MAARKHDASVEADSTGAPAGGANRLQLRMRGRIVRGRNLIDSGREHLAILDQQRAERTTPARADVVNREPYCLLQELLDARHRMIRRARDAA